MAKEAKEAKRMPIKKVQTVREKAEKAVEDNAQPRRLHVTKRRIGAPFRIIGKILRRLEKIKALRILGLVIVPPFMRNSWRELRQVTWPKPRESVRLTSAVLIFAVIFGVTVAIVDYGLDKLFKQVLLN